MFLRQEHFDH